MQMHVARESPGTERGQPDDGRLIAESWRVPERFGVVFDRSIPEFVKQNFAAATERVLKELGIEQVGLSRMICHPGGAKVVDAIEEALHLEQGSLDHERNVLRDYGNMSAPTALFVLKRVAENAPEGDMLLAALGPGFTASMLPIRFGQG